MSVRDDVDPTTRARMRLRYDLLAVKNPDLLQDESRAADFARGCDGIATALETDLGKGAAANPPPGDLINQDARAFWQRCVQDRCEMSLNSLREQRARDIKKVRKWCKKGCHPERAVEVFYGLDLDISFPYGPSGGRNPFKSVVKQEPKADTKLKRKREHVVETATTTAGKGKHRATETAVGKGKQKATESDAIAGASTMMFGLPSPKTPTNARRSPSHSLPPAPKLPGLPPSLPDVLAASLAQPSMIPVAPLTSLQVFAPALKKPDPLHLPVISIASTPEPTAPQKVNCAAPHTSSSIAHTSAVASLPSAIPSRDPGVSRSFPMWTRIDQLAFEILKNEGMAADIRGAAAEASNAHFRYCQTLVQSQVKIVAAEPGATCSSDSGYDEIRVSTAVALHECTTIPALAKEGPGDYLIALFHKRRDFLADLADDIAT